MDSVTWDKYGHCVWCHKNMIYKQVIDNKETIRFSPDYTEGEYLLDNGSKMNVALCQSCKSKLTEDDKEVIMNTVIEGWKQEVSQLDWTDKQKKDYMDKYSQLNIVCNSENKHKDFLEEKLQIHKDLKLKEAQVGSNNKKLHI